MVNDDLRKDLEFWIVCWNYLDAIDLFVFKYNLLWIYLSSAIMQHDTLLRCSCLEYNGECHWICCCGIVWLSGCWRSAAEWLDVLNRQKMYVNAVFFLTDGIVCHSIKVEPLRIRMLNYSLLLCNDLTELCVTIIANSLLFAWIKIS